jgi:hypothetical protein
MRENKIRRTVEAKVKEHRISVVTLWFTVYKTGPNYVVHNEEGGKEGGFLSVSKFLRPSSFVLVALVSV